ncbi:MAG: Ig-like domain-containing protein [Bacteroidota bacterium]
MKLSTYILSSFLIILVLLTTSCKQDTCPGTQRTLDVTPDGPLVSTGTERASSFVELQYPTDCDLFAFRGTLTVEIDNPNVVPGGELFFEQNGQKESLWTNEGNTPEDGLENVEIFLAPLVVNGVEQSMAAGNYQVRLRANFDEPEDNDEVFLQIEVLDGGLNLVITSPENGKLFPEGTQSVELVARASDLSNGIDSVRYRLNGQFNWTSTAYASETNVEFIQQVDLDFRQDVKVYVEAFNGNGERIIDSVSFSVDNESVPITLTDIFWDGGGDGIHWHDPANWEGDIVPNHTHRAIVLSQARLDTLVVTSTGSLADVYRVGAFQLTCDVRMENKAILQIENPSVNSTISRSLSFFQQSNDLEDWSAVRFSNMGFNSNIDSISLFVNTINIAGMKVTGDRKGFISASDAVDDPSIHNESAYAIVEGKVTFQVSDRSTMERSFVFDFGDGGSTIRNKASWSQYGGLELRQTGSGGRVIGGISSLFVNEGFMLIGGARGGTNDSKLLVNHPITFRNTMGQISLLNQAGQDPADAEFFANSTSNELGVINATGNVSLIYGIWEYTAGFSSMNNLIIGSMLYTDRAEPVLSFDGYASNMKKIMVNRGRLRLEASTSIGAGLNSFKDIEVRDEGILTTAGSSNNPKSIEIDNLTLLLSEFLLDKGDVISVEYLNWERARILGRIQDSASMGTLIIKDDPMQRPSILRLSGEFQHNLVLESSAELHWLGGFASVQDPSLMASMTVEANALFLIDTADDLIWGGNNTVTGLQQTLSIYNYGEVRKQGNGNVDIYGCIVNRDNGSLNVQGGSLDFLGNLNCN